MGYSPICCYFFFAPLSDFAGALPSLMSSAMASRRRISVKALCLTLYFDWTLVDERRLRTRGMMPDPWTFRVKRRITPKAFSPAFLVTSTLIIPKE